jgi:hypothetical protein
VVRSGAFLRSTLPAWIVMLFTPSGPTCFTLAVDMLWTCSRCAVTNRDILRWPQLLRGAAGCADRGVTGGFQASLTRTFMAVRELSPPSWA